MSETQQIIFKGPALRDQDMWQFTTANIGELNENEVKVKVSYISIDPAMKGWTTQVRSYIEPVKPGAVMRAFGIGEVIDSKSPNFSKGDWVTAMTGLTDEINLHAKTVQKVDISHLKPTDYLSGLGMTGHTAYFGITEIGQVKEGDCVLISTAAGAVGSIACQVAKNLGARVIGIAGGAQKCEWLKNTINVDGVIDYKNENINDALARETPNGIDVFFDNVGGETLDAVLARINRNARIIVCGAISQYKDMLNVTGPKNYLALLSQSATMRGYTILDYLDRIPESFGQLAKWKAEGKLHYREHILHGLDKFPDGFDMLFRGENTGKLLIQV